ncbi:MAG: hypothetical protein HZA69_04315 [Gammaproteobacteria bacterium]|nr:hypothetical protein [Gammaproteobacteria bacterium]
MPAIRLHFLPRTLLVLGLGLLPVALPDKYPELLAYLPLKFTIFSEGEATLVVTNNPALFAVFFKEPALARTFQHWEKDVRSVLDQLTHQGWPAIFPSLPVYSGEPRPGSSRK